mmetsp:Transcript_21533/g.43628  ORF Transcript_21533/g.43628 Transcript_21533/m.43628 type:complete len:204 (-) Transcript_21533:233-844(-)
MMRSEGSLTSPGCVCAPQVFSTQWRGQSTCDSTSPVGEVSGSFMKHSGCCAALCSSGVAEWCSSDGRLPGGFSTIDSKKEECVCGCQSREQPITSQLTTSRTVLIMGTTDAPSSTAMVPDMKSFCTSMISRQRTGSRARPSQPFQAARNSEDEMRPELSSSMAFIIVSTPSASSSTLASSDWNISSSRCCSSDLLNMPSPLVS